tara:strand:+ start:352 stop:684 length:333 start_codon:yes stop_codon:yes gene_type:complete
VNEEIVKVPIDGTLDLHNFSPKETQSLVVEFINACLSETILSGKIIHGKGIGTLRSIVQQELAKHPMIKDFWTGDESSGGWGVTKFSLKEQHDGGGDQQDACNFIQINKG